MDYPGWPNIITWTLKAGRRRQRREKRGGRGRRDSKHERDLTHGYWLWRWKRFWCRECRWLLEAGEDPHPTVSKQTGFQSYNHKALNLANNLSDLGSGFIPSASWEEGCWHLYLSLGVSKPRASWATMFLDLGPTELLTLWEYVPLTKETNIRIYIVPGTLLGPGNRAASCPCCRLGNRFTQVQRAAEAISFSILFISCARSKLLASLCLSLYSCQTVIIARGSSLELRCKHCEPFSIWSLGDLWKLGVLLTLKCWPSPKMRLCPCARRWGLERQCLQLRENTYLMG